MSNEYKNLKPDELELADHYFEIGDASALRRLQQLSAKRDGRNAYEDNPVAYGNPILIRRLILDQLPSVKKNVT